MYTFKKSGAGSLDSDGMIDLYRKWLDEYPIVSIEDGLAENDWDGWAKLTAALGDRVQLVGDDIFVTSSGEAAIDGLVVAFDKFNLQMRSQSKVLSMHGNLVAKRFYSEGRSEFNLSSTWWSALYSGFNSQNHGSSPSRIYYFPQYCAVFGLQTDPKVTFSPPDNAVTYLWPTDGITFYVADPTDGGLRWELVDWRDLH
jgi:hypothetical protein